MDVAGTLIEDGAVVPVGFVRGALVGALTGVSVAAASKEDGEGVPAGTMVGVARGALVGAATGISVVVAVVPIEDGAGVPTGTVGAFDRWGALVGRAAVGDVVVWGVESSGKSVGFSVPNVPSSSSKPGTNADMNFVSLKSI